MWGLIPPLKTQVHAETAISPHPVESFFKSIIINPANQIQKLICTHSQDFYKIIPYKIKIRQRLHCSRRRCECDTISHFLWKLWQLLPHRDYNCTKRGVLIILRLKCFLSSSSVKNFLSQKSCLCENMN